MDYCDGILLPVEFLFINKRNVFNGWGINNGLVVLLLYAGGDCCYMIVSKTFFNYEQKFYEWKIPLVVEYHH